jgi:hypothetical protein
MKTQTVPRILVLLVLILTLAGASAPAAWAQPAAVSGSHAPAWDLASVFDWLQAFLGGWFGGGGEEEGLQNVTDKAGQVAEPNGAPAQSDSPRVQLSEPW